MYPRTTLAALLAGATLQCLPSVATADSQLHAVVVTATRTEQRVQDTLADVSVIDRDQIEAAGQSTLTDLLARQPGIQVTNNGGPGTDIGFFIRGASAKQNVVLVDGMRVGSTSTGSAALQYLPLSQIDRIEILRGPASAIYGSDAMGGVIQIFTRRGEPGLQAEAFAGGGNYGTADSRVGISGGDDRWRFSLGAGFFRSHGFDATNARASSYSRNADADGYLNRNASAAVTFKPAASTEIGGNMLYTSGTNDHDSGATFRDTRTKFENYSGSLFLKQDWNDRLSTTVRAGHSVDNTNSFASYSPVGNRVRSTQDALGLEAQYRLSFGSLFASVERLEQEVDSQDNFSARRTIDSVQLGGTFQLDAHSAQLNVRHDSYSGASGNKTTGNIAYGYRISEHWRAHGSYGTAFRLPSFNELYYPFFGNPDLAPESSRNREAGLSWQGGSSRAGVTAYYNTVDNLIDTAQVAPDLYIAQNVARARLRGLTFDGSTYIDHTELSGNVDLLDAEDAETGLRLQRRATRTANLVVQQHLNQGRVGVEWRLSGPRYSQAGELDRLPGYAVVNLFGVWKVTRELALEGRINNLTDRNYSTVLGYETAGVNAFVGVRYTPQL